MRTLCRILWLPYFDRYPSRIPYSLQVNIDQEHSHNSPYHTKSINSLVEHIQEILSSRPQPSIMLHLMTGKISSYYKAQWGRLSALFVCRLTVNNDIEFINIVDCIIGIGKHLMYIWWDEVGWCEAAIVCWPASGMQAGVSRGLSLLAITHTVLECAYCEAHVCCKQREGLVAINPQKSVIVADVVLLDDGRPCPLHHCPRSHVCCHAHCWARRR